MASVTDIGVPGQPMDDPPLTPWQAAVRDALDSSDVTVDARISALALDDLADVDAATPADGDALVWDEGAGAWVPGEVATGGGGGGGGSTVAGGATTDVGDYRVHTFTSGASLTVTGSIDVEVLVVAGGGGGGAARTGSWGGAGGGGAGGLVLASLALTGSTYTVTIGAGGNGAADHNSTGAVGGNSVFSSVTAVGGGGGGSSGGGSATGGGSGGGAKVNSTGGAGTASQGYNGGDAVDASPYGGAGGGGSSAAGVNTSTVGNAGSNGGAGTSNSYTGTAVTYAAGGGGGSGNSGAAGNGGSAQAGYGGANANGTAATGYGNGGGGGGGPNARSGGNGSSGIVVVRYLIADLATGGGGSAGGSRYDDPADVYWTDDLGYDLEFETDGSSLPSGWAWTNQGDATYTQTLGAALLATPTGAGDQGRALDRAIPSESTWEVVVRAYPALPADYSGWGIAVRDSATGKVCVWGSQENGGTRLSVTYWTLPGSSITHPLLWTTTLALTYPYWKVRKNSATSWTFSASMDGIAWRALDSARNITTSVANPTHLGLFIWRSGSSSQVAVHWFRVR